MNLIIIHESNKKETTSFDSYIADVIPGPSMAESFVYSFPYLIFFFSNIFFAVKLK